MNPKTAYPRLSLSELEALRAGSRWYSDRKARDTVRYRITDLKFRRAKAVLVDGKSTLAAAIEEDVSQNAINQAVQTVLRERTK